MAIPQNVINTVSLLLAEYGFNFREMLKQREKSINENFPVGEWLDLKTAAAYAQVSTWTIRRWTKKGVISKKTSTAKCGRVLINLISLQQYIEKLPDGATTNETV